MSIKKTLLSLSALMMILVLGACQKATPEPTPTQDPGLVITAAAQTAAVRLTEIALSTPSVTPTSAEPTQDLAMTAAVQTVMAQLTSTASVATITPTLGPSPTVNPGVVEKLEFLADVTIPDKTVIAAGTAFVKTWRVKNAGTSNWTTAYQLSFVQGDRMGGPERVALASAVGTGATVDISLNLTAPTAPGTYIGYWRLLSPTGVLLNDPIYVEIVVAGGTATVTGTPATPTPSVTPGGPTSTVTPGTAPTATLTPPPAGLVVSNVTAAVDSASFTGACPHTINVSGSFQANQAGNVTYKWEAGSDTAGFTFSLPPASTGLAAAGTNHFSLQLDISSSVSGWVKLHVTAPQDTASSQVAFSVTCQP